jgi:tRNA 2-selenouridine synthase
MALISVDAAEVLQRLDGYDTIVDARSPSEFALDRLPGAVNWPSLDDEERALIGTEYKQVSAFAARKRGAAMVARNVSAHIESHVIDRPKVWSPLIYCWRGGQRSGALAMVLSQIGFRVQVIDGGYRAWRRALVESLDGLADSLQWTVICGRTGSGKSRLLGALRSQGAQVLDLENLANHRGSVLGLVPGCPQPSQKQFDTRLWNELRRFDSSRTVWVESESRKVGALRVPERLIQRMRASPCVHLEMPTPARVDLLMEDYDFFVRDVNAFCERLDALRTLRGNDTVNAWQVAARSGQIAGVVDDLLVTHYDPVYLQSMKRNFAGFEQARPVQSVDGRRETLNDVAAELMALESVSPNA